MKKFLIIFLLLCLSACTISENETVIENTTEPTPEVSETVEIVEKDTDHHYDRISYSNTWKLEGDASYVASKNLQYLNIKANNEIILSIDEVYLLEGKYLIDAEILSDGNAEIKLEILDDEDNLIYSETTNGSIEYDNQDVLYTAKIQYHIKALDDCNIKIENFKIHRPDDVYKVKINQVGYKNEHRKIAFFSGWNGDYFNVINANTNEIVNTFGISEYKYSKASDEYVGFGDFTDITEDGIYYIESSLGYRSYNFEVGNKVYDELYNDSLKMLTIQRCNSEVSEELSSDMAHEKCHDRDATIYSTGEKIDVRGGWHDAGDYGRYVETGVKVLSDLLLAYISNKNSFSDSENLVHLNNGILDILDEAKYELDWLFKMQREDGAVYSRAVTKSFAGEVLPEDDDAEIYVLQVSSASSAGFGAVMALAYDAFRDYDIEYANKCLNASKKAFKYVSSNTEYNPVLPGEFSAGDYNLASEWMYRYYLGIALWYVTDDINYLNFANDNIDLNDFNIYSLYWCPILTYPSYLFIKKGDSSLENYDEVKENFLTTANGYVDGSKRDAYHNSLYDNFKWGSNQNVADRAMILLLAYDLSDKLEYYDVASEHLAYLLGSNTLNYCFVSGFGSLYPKYIHHRITMVKNSLFKGALVGGPNSSMDDEVARNKFKDLNYGPARIYIDDENSYSTNEIANHFNSSLIFILSHLK